MNANGYSGNVAIYAPNAWTALWNNQKVKDLMKNTVGFVPISGNTIGETPPTGVTKAPDFFYPVMQNWIYSGTYSSGGTAVRYVPPGCVLIGSSNVQHRLVYSSVTQIEQTDGEFHTYLLARVPKFECNVNKNFYMLTLSSRPVPVPLDLLLVGSDRSRMMEKEKTGEKVKLRQSVMIDSKIFPIGAIMNKADIPPRLRTREILAEPDEDLGRLEYHAPEESEVDTELIFEPTLER